MKKKICFIIPKVYPLFNQEINSTFGGAEKQVYLLGISLAKIENIEINYCVRDYGQEEIERIGNINIYKAFSFKDNIFISLRKILKRVKEIKPDYCIFRGDDKKIFFLAMIIKIFLRKKYIFWISHDYLVSKKSILNHQLFKNAYRVIAQTNDQKKMLERNYSINSIVIRNIFMENDMRNNKEFNRDVILWVGRSEKWKRPEIFLDLAKSNPNENFIMIMSVATKKGNYFKKIKSLALECKNVLFLSDMKFEDIKDYYKRTKLFVITSKAEGFSNTMMEAMDFKCPILSLKVNPDNIINDYNIGLCADDDLDIFNKIFQALIKDKNKLNNLGNNCKRYLLKNHNADILIKSFINAMDYD